MRKVSFDDFNTGRKRLADGWFRIQTAATWHFYRMCSTAGTTAAVSTNTAVQRRVARSTACTLGMSRRQKHFFISAMSIAPTSHHYRGGNHGAFEEYLVHASLDIAGALSVGYEPMPGSPRCYVLSLAGADPTQRVWPLLRRTKMDYRILRIRSDDHDLVLLHRYLRVPKDLNSSYRDQSTLHRQILIARSPLMIIKHCLCGYHFNFWLPTLAKRGASLTQRM